MKTIRFGKTELMVSELGFGGIPIIPVDFKEAVKIVRHCFKQGITFYDTANAYIDSERKIGEALEDVRDKVILATKTGLRDAEGAAKHIAYSLENLRTDYIDIYQFHNVVNEKELEQIFAPGGAYEAVEKAHGEGKIRHIGITSHDNATAINCCRTGRFSTIQIPFNFIEREPADELFNVAQEMDIGIIGMKPLGGGLLERADLCMKFLQQYPNVLPIPGFSTLEEADEVIDLYVSPQPLSDIDQKEIAQIRSELGSRFCHRCGYCLPCEQGVRIVEIMSFRSQARRVSPAVIVNFVKQAMETVEDCTECGECLERCPYSLEIPDLIREHLAAYNDLVAKHA